MWIIKTRLVTARNRVSDPDTEPHWFWKLDPDQELTRHKMELRGAVDAQNEGAEAQNGGLETL
jgi:hypothetical protein